jgi:hypothetical protein
MEYKGIAISGSDAYNVTTSLTRPTVRTLSRIKWSVYHAATLQSNNTRNVNRVLIWAPVKAPLQIRACAIWFLSEPLQETCCLLIRTHN